MRITRNTLNALREANIFPKIILQIDGLDYIIGSGVVFREALIGDDLIIGEFIIGGNQPLPNQKSLISFDKTTSKIAQNLEPDKGRASTISSVRVQVIDKDNTISRLISPTLELDDILYKDAKVFIGFGDNTRYPDDYIRVFKGVIDDIGAGAGFIEFNVSATDQKKRQRIFEQKEATLVGSIANSGNPTFIDVADLSGEALSLPRVPTENPFVVLTIRDLMELYVKVDDEIFKYELCAFNDVDKTGSFKNYGDTPMDRAQLGSLIASHSDGAPVSTLYRLKGNTIDMALKFMLSDSQGSEYLAGVELSAINYISSTESIPNTLIFKGVKLLTLHNIQEGDLLTLVDAETPANDMLREPILSIREADNNTYITVAKTLVDQLDVAGEVSFKSKYNVLPDGLGMKPDDVDIAAHLRLTRLFLSSANLDIFLTEDIENGKDFIAEELYLPFACYELIREARSSVGIHVGPIPSDSLVSLNSENIKKPNEIVLRRSIARNFYNTIIFRYEKEMLGDRFLKGLVEVSQDSKNVIKTGTRALVISSQGLREAEQGTEIALRSARRLLARYAFGAEYIRNLKVLFSAGIQIEIGDSVLIDFTDLQVTNTRLGNREKPPALYEVVNRTIDFKNGEVILDITDTNYSLDSRYALISPASKVSDGFSEKQFTIKPSYNLSQFGSDEFLKWLPFVSLRDKPKIRVRNDDFSLLGESRIDAINSNTITLTDDLGFIPTEDMILELAEYAVDQTDKVKTYFVHLSDGDNSFADGTNPYGLL